MSTTSIYKGSMKKKTNTKKLKKTDEDHYNVSNTTNNERLPIDIDNIFKDDDFVIVTKCHFNDRSKIIRDKTNTTWVDKYRPKTLNDIVGHDDVKNMLISSIERGNLPHLLFHGGSGTGKTSAVLALVMQLYGPRRINEKVLELNASDENGINVVRDKIIKFANIVVGSSDPKYPSPSFKIVILDEADSMTAEAQTALKKVMESTCAITRFVFICNYESKIIDAIKSRCADFRFSPIPDDVMIEKLKIIANDENMIVDDDVFDTITEICEGDARRSINTLQNLKYIPRRIEDRITREDVYEITSYLDKTYLDPYWNKIITSKIDQLKDVVVSITNLGYPMTYILLCIKDKVIESKLSDKNKSQIMIHMAKIERMITSGSDNWIQLLAVLTYINALYRGIDVNKPNIY
jgi:replication factor C subunit 2/4